MKGCEGRGSTIGVELEDARLVVADAGGVGAGAFELRASVGAGTLEACVLTVLGCS